MTVVVGKVNFIQQVFYIGDKVCFVFFAFAASQRTYLFKAQLVFVYNFCGSKPDRTTSCHKLLTHEDGYCHKPFPCPLAFPHLHTDIPKQPHKK